MLRKWELLGLLCLAAATGCHDSSLSGLDDSPRIGSPTILTDAMIGRRLPSELLTALKSLRVPHKRGLSLLMLRQDCDSCHSLIEKFGERIAISPDFVCIVIDEREKWRLEYSGKVDKRSSPIVWLENQAPFVSTPAVFASDENGFVLQAVEGKENVTTFLSKAFN